jgi:DNA-binding transcriptional MerR regulator
MHDPETEPKADGDAALIKIGDFARRAGTNLRTLRYYEELGLVLPAARSAGGLRYYRAAELDRMAMIAGLQRLGLELVQIRGLLATREPGASREESMARVRHALSEQGELIDQRLAELTAQRRRVDEALAKLGECDACSHHPAVGNNFCHPCQLDGRPLPADLSALF